MTDMEIIRNSKMESIDLISRELGISKITKYGEYIAKIDPIFDGDKGKLILVTAMNPTKYGEGKTTVSIGLLDGLRKLGLSSGAVLREPSLGPVFGLKGGATGGGYSQVNPMESINLHFTGDFHAITSATNLLASAIDNHIYFGNELGIQTVTFKRAIDINDRSLRENFQITAASEMMTIFCVSKDFDDLKRRIGNIIIGYRKDNQPVFAHDLHIEGALTVLLKDAFRPNLVQTLENNPVLIHGGPFANVSIGTSSITSILTGMHLFDYTVTEAGFGADLGAEKFLDILCRNHGIVPNVVVLVVTVKALSLNGMENLEAHLDNLEKMGMNVVVAINEYSDDSLEKLKGIKDYCMERNVPCSSITSYMNGGDGAVSLAKTVIENMTQTPSIKYPYELNQTITEKIENICKKIYHAGNVQYQNSALEMIKKLEDMGIHYPVCIAKTPYSISDDKDKLGYPKDYTITVQEVELLNGAELVVVKLNHIMTMPGLPKNPNYEKIDLDQDHHIVGLF